MGKKKQLIPDGLPKELTTYYYRRYSLFSKFDKGIQLNHEQWYSVTPEDIARITANQVQLRFPHCQTIFDPFGGAGGNTIQFALKFPKIWHNEIDCESSRHAMNNAKVYGVRDKVEFINKDFYSLINGEDVQDDIDVVFMSLPWGGPKYLGEEYWDLRENRVFEAVEKAKEFSQNICLFLPKSSKLDQVAELVGDSQSKADVDYMFVKGKCKGICIYMGPDIINNDYTI